MPEIENTQEEYDETTPDITCPECGRRQSERPPMRVRIAEFRFPPWLTIVLALSAIGALVWLNTGRFSSSSGGGPRYAPIAQGLTVADLRAHIDSGAPGDLVLRSLREREADCDSGAFPCFDSDPLRVHGGRSGSISHTWTIGWPASWAVLQRVTVYGDIARRSERQDSHLGAPYLDFGGIALAVVVALGAGRALLLLGVIARRKSNRRAISQSRKGRSLWALLTSRRALLLAPWIAILAAAAVSAERHESVRISGLRAQGGLTPGAIEPYARADVGAQWNGPDAELRAARAVLARIPPNTPDDGLIMVGFGQTGTVHRHGVRYGSWAELSVLEMATAPPRPSRLAFSGDSIVYKFESNAESPEWRRFTIRPPSIALWLVGAYLIVIGFRFTLSLVLARKHRKRRAQGRCTACGYDLTALTAAPTATDRHTPPGRRADQ